MYPEIKTIKNNPALSGQFMLARDIEYSKEHAQRLDIIYSWAAEFAPGSCKLPLIVFLQGSAWTYPDRNFQLPQLASIARKGYVIATIEHRDSLKGHPWPAFLEDTKTAIRFLRSNADKYGIDKEKVVMFGTSSGGNTALLVGVTGDDPALKTNEYAEESDSVSAVVDCFGPSDLTRMFPNEITENFKPEDNALFLALSGKEDPFAVEKAMSPVLRLEKGKKYPPFLIMHGGVDPVVPFEQSENMFRALNDIGAQAELVRVENAEHEGTFWSDEVWNEALGFINKKL